MFIAYEHYTTFVNYFSTKNAYWENGSVEAYFLREGTSERVGCFRTARVLNTCHHITIHHYVITR